MYKDALCSTPSDFVLVNLCWYMSENEAYVFSLPSCLALSKLGLWTYKLALSATCSREI